MPYAESQAEEIRLATEVKDYLRINNAQLKLSTQQFPNPNNVPYPRSENLSVEQFLDTNHVFHPLSEKLRLLCWQYKISDQY